MKGPPRDDKKFGIFKKNTNNVIYTRDQFPDGHKPQC